MFKSIIALLLFTRLL